MEFIKLSVQMHKTLTAFNLYSLFENIFYCDSYTLYEFSNYEYAFLLSSFSIRALCILFIIVKRSGLFLSLS